MLCDDGLHRVAEESDDAVTRGRSAEKKATQGAFFEYAETRRDELTRLNRDTEPLRNAWGGNTTCIYRIYSPVSRVV
jgi:uncharacterized protein YukE